MNTITFLQTSIEFDDRLRTYTEDKSCVTV